MHIPFINSLCNMFPINIINKNKKKDRSQRKNKYVLQSERQKVFQE